MIILAASREWYWDMADALSKRLSRQVKLVKSPAELYEVMNLGEPIEWAFFPHWSWKIPSIVYSKVDCVIFHMTDLPFGRGGSPLQNLITRGYRKTMVTALRCVEEMDAGPIFLKRELSLEGSAKEIFSRMVPIIKEMIVEIVSDHPVPTPQSGKPTLFKRRTPGESEIAGIKSLNAMYDHIRMLDANGYPKAYLLKDGWRIEFESATIDGEEVVAKARIFLEPK